MNDITIEITDDYKQAQVIVDELESRFGSSRDFFNKSIKEQLNILPVRRVIDIWANQLNLIKKVESISKDLISSKI